MTKRVAIPAASLARLRTAYHQVEQISAIVAEAIGIDPRSIERLDLPGGAFLVRDDPLARLADEEAVRQRQADEAAKFGPQTPDPEVTNGVAAPATRSKRT